MLVSLKNYVVLLGYRLRTKIEVDNDFYEEQQFYVIDLEG